MQRVHIAKMGRFFWYAPVEYAVANAFWSPDLSGISINTDIAGQPTDLGALRQLLGSQSRDKTWFAMCDPAVLIDLTQEERKPIVVIAALVTNFPFWAANHKTYKVNSFKDLAQFGSIVSFKEGTTSHAVATLIAQRSSPGKEVKITGVSHPDEISALMEGGHDTLILTPELPLLIKNRKEHDISILLGLGETVVGANLLTTVLVTRSDIILSNPGVVKQVVAGIARATDEAHANEAGFVKWVHRYFAEYNVEATEALDVARKNRIFPTSVEVSEGAWTKALSLRLASRTPAIGDDAAEALAMELFETHVRPYKADVVLPAIALGRELAMRKHSPRWSWSGAIAVATSGVVALVAGVAALSLPRLSPSMISLGGWMWPLVVAAGGVAVGGALIQAPRMQHLSHLRKRLTVAWLCGLALLVLTTLPLVPDRMSDILLLLAGVVAGYLGGVLQPSPGAPK